jgi:hypothetical protein
MKVRSKMPWRKWKKRQTKIDASGCSKFGLAGFSDRRE